jgi:hypothetical protein
VIFQRWIVRVLAFLWLFASAGRLSAQQTPGQTVPVLPTSPEPAAKMADEKPFHRFWDRENDLLFAGVAGARVLDYSSTLNMRRRGRQEILLSNWVVDHHGLFAGVEASGVALSVGASYVLHRTGHHKLERWVSIVHIGVGTGGAIRNYSLKTFHAAP